VSKVDSLVFLQFYGTTGSMTAITSVIPHRTFFDVKLTPDALSITGLDGVEKEDPDAS